MINDRSGTKPSLAIVVPVLDEEEGIQDFHTTLVEVLETLSNPWRVYYVDDGSTDETPAILWEMAKGSPKVAVVHLTRNFGHQAAVTAGLDHAEEDIVITMDADGQHPPRLIPEMLELYDMGYEVVLTQREGPENVGWFKRASADLFYRLINRISATEMVPRSADFRLLSKHVVKAIREMREYHRFLRGMISWMGFRTVILPFRPEGRIAGRSKYSLSRMLRLAADAAFSFSLVPLYLGLLLGGLFILLAIAEVIYVLNFWIRGAQAGLAPGWSSLMFMMLIVGGTISIILGLIGVYVGYIFQEVKRRPIYIVSQVTIPLAGGQTGISEPVPDP